MLNRFGDIVYWASIAGAIGWLALFLVLPRVQQYSPSPDDLRLCAAIAIAGAPPILLVGRTVRYVLTGKC
ncbi:hypothetical protein [Bradyrhizobium sp. ORS 86]|uniref:hypothetical protein n=1 Tax=unclassified Bradyrhizobium TaxID=2631580 RepID=UPI00388E572E